jgi:hypothetical protein
MIVVVRLREIDVDVHVDIAFVGVIVIGRRCSSLAFPFVGSDVLLF